jgi:perosamine synthetase
LDLARQAGAVVEINARATDREIGPEARTDNYSVEIGKQEPAGELMKADNLLPKLAKLHAPSSTLDSMGDRMISVNEPLLGERESEYVTDCVRTGWISSAGRYIKEFENGWASYCGRRYGIGVSNGTAALQTAVACLGLKPGDEVIMPTFTIISCALAVVYSGGVPVLVDCKPPTWCMDVEQVKDKVTARTRAIMPVHIYGHPVDMDPILDLAETYGLAVIEDAAEVHGAEYLAGRHTAHPAWRRCGSFGTLSCFSFYANKLITTGEGGMVLTDDPKLAEKARSLRNLCFEPNRRFHHEELGFNFRLTNLQAALGVAQLERIEEIIARKRWIGQEYNRRLVGIKNLQLPVEEPWARNVYWMYGVVLSEKAGMDTTAFAQRLKEWGIETRPFFLGLHEQPAFHQKGLFLEERHPVAERIARQGLYLPSGLALTEGQIAKVCDAVHEVLS